MYRSNDVKKRGVLITHVFESCIKVAISTCMDLKAMFHCKNISYTILIMRKITISQYQIRISNQKNQNFTVKNSISTIKNSISTVKNSIFTVKKLIITVKNRLISAVKNGADFA